MGKTRLAAEIAGEAHREGASVLYAAGTGPPEAALAAIARTRETRRPALLVIDDADRAPADVRIALRDLDVAALPALVLATGQEAAALARLEPRESILLEPLAADSVQEIAGFYAPAGAAAVPVETLLATSRGVPRRVHEAASEWARREATRRVDAAADRAEAGRTEARAMVDELAGSVVELQSTRERAAGHDAADDRVVCPYKGLAPFDADDADYFFGRERLVAELVARLVGAPLLAVVGPSGSGKSSVVRAGLLPALAGGVLPGSHNWTQALIRPGRASGGASSGARRAGSPASAAACSRSTSSKSCSPPATTRTNATEFIGGVGARRPKRHHRRARRPRRFLRALRRLPRAVRPARRQQCARRPDVA